MRAFHGHVGEVRLLDNAIKYSGQARKILVRSFVKGPDVVVSVQDFGVGIKREDIDRVFDRFYRCGDAPGRAAHHVCIPGAYGRIES